MGKLRENKQWMEMDGAEVEERDAVFNKHRSIPGCALGFTVTACLSPFVSHKGHMETFSWLKADRRTLSRACNICYLFSRSILIKFSEKYIGNCSNIT